MNDVHARRPGETMPTHLRTYLRALAVLLLAQAGLGSAQENPLSAHQRVIYGGMKKILLRSAELMPEEGYGFKPTDSVRTFGQILGHVADAQYAFCSVALGEKNPAPKVEKTKTSKAELVVALKDALAYCDKAYEGLTDATASQMVSFHGADTPRLGVLTVNQVHGVEHYGNLVTYLRMKGLVPPTSDPEFMKGLQPPPKK